MVVAAQQTQQTNDIRGGAEAGGSTAGWVNRHLLRALFWIGLRDNLQKKWENRWFPAFPVSNPLNPAFQVLLSRDELLWFMTHVSTPWPATTWPQESVTNSPPPQEERKHTGILLGLVEPMCTISLGKWLPACFFGSRRDGNSIFDIN